MTVGRLGRIAGPRPVALPPVGRVAPSTRVRLVSEILAGYVLLGPSVRRNDVRAMADAARSAPKRLAVDPGEHQETAQRLGKVVRSTFDALPMDGKCLIRSLVLIRMLQGRGIASRLIIGVRPGPAFLAHAWVELDARPLLPSGGLQRLLEL